MAKHRERSLSNLSFSDSLVSVSTIDKLIHSSSPCQSPGHCGKGHLFTVGEEGIEGTDAGTIGGGGGDTGTDALSDTPTPGSPVHGTDTAASAFAAGAGAGAGAGVGKAGLPLPKSFPTLIATPPTTTTTAGAAGADADSCAGDMASTGAPMPDTACEEGKGRRRKRDEGGGDDGDDDDEPSDALPPFEPDNDTGPDTDSAAEAKDWIVPAVAPTPSLLKTPLKNRQQQQQQQQVQAQALALDVGVDSPMPAWGANAAHAAPGGITSPRAAQALSPIIASSANASGGGVTVRLLVHSTDSEAVRQLWSEGLLSNARDPLLGYPAGLVAEAENFVRETLDAGDMADLGGFYGTGDERGKRVRAMWVAIEDCQVVGCVGLRESSVDATEAEVCRLGVAAWVRGRGVARSLLAAAEEHALSKRIVRLTATTVSLNSAALACCEACSFAEEYRGRKDGKHGEPDFVRVVRALQPRSQA